MKLPIHLDIEKETIWTVYREERNQVKDLEGLKRFVERWQALFPEKIEADHLNERILEAVESEGFANKADAATPDGITALNIILPPIILKAMIAAQKYVVPLNCAFIQMNGGLGAFEEVA